MAEGKGLNDVAPKGPNISAHGNALGNGKRKPAKVLKGRNKVVGRRRIRGSFRAPQESLAERPFRGQRERRDQSLPEVSCAFGTRLRISRATLRVASRLGLFRLERQNGGHLDRKSGSFARLAVD